MGSEEQSTKLPIAEMIELTPVEMAAGRKAICVKRNGIHKTPNIAIYYFKG